MTTRKKSVILKDWNMEAGNDCTKLSPKAGINIAYHLIDKKNKECYATLFGSDKANSPNEIVTKEEINNQLSVLSKNILSDRVRTLNQVPKWHSINSVVEKIQ